VAELAYARVSSEKQSLERQIHALTEAGIDRERIYVDKKSGASTDRPGLRKLLEYAREGDRITVLTLDRLGRTVRDTLNLIHELDDRKIGLRNLAERKWNGPMSALTPGVGALPARFQDRVGGCRSDFAQSARKRRIGRVRVRQVSVVRLEARVADRALEPARLRARPV